MEIQSMKSFAKILNDQTFTDYYYRLMLLARSVFKWNNLPGNVNEKWIENFLFHHGKCVVYEDPKRGIMVAECLDNGKVNNYNEPVCVAPAGVGVQSRTLTPGKDCVVIRNNDEMIPSSYTLKLFAYRLAEISRTIDVNIQAQKTPVLVVGSDKQMKSLQTIYNQFDGNKPVYRLDLFDCRVGVQGGFDGRKLRGYPFDLAGIFPKNDQRPQGLGRSDRRPLGRGVCANGAGIRRNWRQGQYERYV